MKNSDSPQFKRRDFIRRVVPACTLMCCSGGAVLAGLTSKACPLSNPQEHMFDRENPRKLTFRQSVEMTNFQFRVFAKKIIEKYGKKDTIDLIKEMTTDWNLERGKLQAEQTEDHSLKSYTRMFANPASWEGMLNMEVVEDSETAFELKVHECIQAANYIEHDAAEIGYAAVCWGDYAWAEGFNPKIKLVRDKTLMQGHDCCNHRYIWVG